MSANLLTLKCSKTEFLLKQQLSNIDSSCLVTTHSARNLGFVFDEHLTFSDQISALSPAIYTGSNRFKLLLLVVMYSDVSINISKCITFVFAHSLSQSTAA